MAKGKGKKAKGPILAPVDFSKSSVKAVMWACTLAKKFDTDIIIYHAVHDPAETPGFYNKGKKNLNRPHEDVAQRMMKKFFKRIQSIIPKYMAKRITTKVEKGLPAQRILKTVKKHDAMMIVMGATGQSQLKKVLFGSIAEEVVQQATVPVLSVKKDQRP
ncbi:MAG: universal stress protein [Alphaproteobacteria bacterium]|nr:universal stress protein [Rhodospirillales bacterium]MCW9045908.1 universal stress protein [Alphaproteobacteria bacterium]